MNQENNIYHLMMIFHCSVAHRFNQLVCHVGTYRITIGLPVELPLQDGEIVLLQLVL